MYSNNKSFNLVDILVKIVFFIIFIFVLVYLFPQVSDLNPFYSNVFRENLSYMEDAAEDYFNNTSNQPMNVGETNKLTLKEMINNNLIIPFVDKDNNSCNLYESYALLTKLENGYKLKVNLVCNDEENYIERTLGCNNYCDGVNCKNACTSCTEENIEEEKCYDIKKVVYYEHKKENITFNTTWQCEEGYNLNDNKVCYRIVEAGRSNAIALYEADKTNVVNAIKISGSEYKEYVSPKAVEETIETKVVIPGGSYTTGGGTTCTPVTSTESYSCNCKVTEVNGKASTTCNTCTRTVTTQSCASEGSYTVNLPDKIESKYETVTSYVCPEGTDGSIGNGANKQCYYIKSTPDSYKCADASATRVGTLCYTTIKGAFKEWSCPAGYILNGNTCYLNKTETKNAFSNTISSSSFQYQWSTSQNIAGWTKTGNTKVDYVKTEVECNK